MTENQIVGTGRLAGVLRARLGAGRDGLVIVAHDGWQPEPPEPSGGAALLPVWTELDKVVAGPLWTPGTPGCPWCAQERRRRARPEVAAVRDRHRDELAHQVPADLTEMAAHTVAAVIARDVERRRAGEPAHLAGALAFVDLPSLTVRRHRFLADPRCPTCGGLPDDTADAARLTIGSPAASRPGSYRQRSLTTVADELAALYHDEETGLVRALAHSAQGGVTFAAAEIGLRGGGSESGYGRSPVYRTSRVTAIAEALERYAGMEPGGRRTTVRAAYAEVRAHAVDPRSFGWHDGPPFDEDTPYRWVWAHSFRRAEPVLVPESYAYYRSRDWHPDEPPLLYEVSNGCALGSGPEEAVLHGILEVAERDAFLLTWYARRTPARLDLSSADPALPLLAASIEARTGCRIELFDITAEQGLPAVWALAVDDTGRPDRAAAACAAACHPDQGQAVRNALNELGPLLPDLSRAYAARTDLARAMAQDPALVTEMEHHALLYAEPSTFHRFDFLTGGTESVPLRPDEIGRGDLGAALTEIVGRYLDTGLDVVVVDQTTPEHRTGGFACVKVIIPGALPMTFGHRNRRVRGLPRLSAAAGSEPINPHPHPFP